MKSSIASPYLQESPTRTKLAEWYKPACLAALALRFILFAFTNAHKNLMTRIEVSTPLTSWKTATEGLYLFENGLQPYDGGVFHQAPLFLPLLYILNHLPRVFTWLLFVAIDALIAVLLFQLAVYRRNQQEGEAWAPRTPPSIAYPNASLADVPVPSDDSDSEPEKPRIKPRSLRSSAKLQEPTMPSELIREVPTKSTLQLMYDPHNQLRPIDSLIDPWFVSLVYLWNPLTILTCLSQSTILFNTLTVIASLATASKKQKSLSIFLLALATYQTIYPVMWLGCCVLLLDGRNLAGSLIQPRPTDKTLMKLAAQCTGLFLLYLGGLFWLSHGLVHSWSFIPSVYGFALKCKDLQPNIGLWWYLFMEMFDAFRDFFIGVFQLHLLSWIIPITLRFRYHPLLAATLLCMIQAIFKPYPSLGDVALYLALLPLHSELFKYMRNLFLVSNLFVWAVILGPTFYHLWIQLGSANSNFFYAITLVWALAQIFLVLDIGWSQLRREWDRLEGGWRGIAVQHR